MSERVNGSGGIPLKGREKEYATELWLDDPTAFWLHPEGPMSDTTPDEWLAKQPKPSPYANTSTNYYAAGMLNHSSMLQLQAMQAQMQYSAAQNQLQRQSNMTPLANFMGGLIPF